LPDHQRAEGYNHPCSVFGLRERSDHLGVDPCSVCTPSLAMNWTSYPSSVPMASTGRLQRAIGARSKLADESNHEIQGAISH
jgi:hypothetical protein